MKNLFTITFLFFICLISFCKINAQISVGSNNTENNFSLDLNSSITNDKGIILPKASTQTPYPTGINLPPGTLLFNESEKLIFYSTDNSGSYNSLSPWSFKPLTNFIYFNQIGNVGIGTSSPITKLTISEGTQIVNNNSHDGYLAILNDEPVSTQKILKLDVNEISYSHSPSNSTLGIQRFGGTLKLGTDDGVKKHKTNLNVTGRVKEDGNDLLPVGTIIMYSHDTIPSGWGVCDGSTYQKTDKSGSIISPNLTDRFIVAAGNEYSVDDIGGKNNVQLSLNEMPVHNHNVSVANSSGSHSHYYGSRGYLTDIALCCHHSGTGADGSQDDNNITNRGGGSHTHTVSQNNVGENDSHENRPSFVRLIYLIKL